MVASTRIGEKGDPDAYSKFLMNLPLDYWTPAFKTAPNQVTGRLQLRYQDWLRARYRNDIGAVNAAYIDENVGFQTALPPAELLERKTWRPPDSRKYREWREFKATLSAEFRMPIRAQRLFQEYLRGKYQGQIDSVPAEIKGTAKTFEEIETIPTAEFMSTVLPDRYRKETVEDRWRATGATGPLPIVALEARILAADAPSLRSEFAGRNYSYVLDYVLINGRAILNTALFCFLAMATQLIVNPLAAYALSRYPIRQSGQILIFLLATMAFPAEVAMIPSFLLLKDLGLLNTFAALVLPTAASGYMIFLLKGFFDSLPQELYEAAQMDGAKEATMMTRIALPLSKPVLGYLALIAFMGAYGAFIYAFLIAQDQQMWTLMVWVYQLQNMAPKSVMMAALTVAAVPTLLVFLFAQRVIIRGIVLPGER
jgi:multiple sugar transport system permease protein